MPNFEMFVILVAGVLAERVAFRLARYDLVPFISRLQGNEPPRDPARDALNMLRRHGL